MSALCTARRCVVSSTVAAGSVECQRDIVIHLDSEINGRCPMLQATTAVLPLSSAVG